MGKFNLSFGIVLEKKMFQHFRLTLTSLFILLFILPACDYVDDGPTSTELKRVVYTLPVLDIQGTASSDGITITFEKTVEWDEGNGDRGFAAKITILNETGNTLNDWGLNFDFLAEITSMWNASYTQAENTFVILPANWNSSIDDGTSRDFGFNGVYSGVFQEPSVYLFSSTTLSIPVGDQTLPKPIIPVCTLNTVFNVTSHWSTGSDTYGFVANMHLTNIGEEPVNWELDFDLAADIDGMWEASFERDGNHYVVTPVSHNVRIEPNQTILFGFSGSYAGSLQPEPQNTVCNKDDVVENQLEIVSQHILADVAELGQVNVSQGSRDHWHSITTLQTYTDPVVIMQPLSYNDPEPATVRLRQVGPQGFEFQIQEWDYLDGVHPLETVNYMVAEKGLYYLNGFIMKAGTVDVNHEFTNVFLFYYQNHKYEQPVVLSQVQTVNDPTTVTTRQRFTNLDTFSEQGFEVKLQTQKANGQVHGEETVGYVILEPSKGNIITTSDYTNYYVVSKPDGVDHNWHNFAFPASLTTLPDIEPVPTIVSQTPYFFTSLQSTNEDDTATLRYRQLTTGGVDVFIEEEQSESSEPEHAAETIGVAAFVGIQLEAGQETPVAIALRYLVENDFLSQAEAETQDFFVREIEYVDQDIWRVHFEMGGQFAPTQFDEDHNITTSFVIGGDAGVSISKATGEVLDVGIFQ